MELCGDTNTRALARPTGSRNHALSVFGSFREETVRTRVALAALVAAAAVPGSASAIDPTPNTRTFIIAPPRVGIGSCDLRAINNVAECIVKLNANPNGGFYVATRSGWGKAELLCFVEPRHIVIEGGYGTQWETFAHGDDVCLMIITATAGTTDAYVD